MSQPLPPDAAGIDWKLVGSAVGVFVATIVTTVWGWFQGRKKSQTASVGPADIQVAGAVLQDNASLRDNTRAVKDLRDQIMLLVHIMERHSPLQEDLHDDIKALLRRLDGAG